MVKYFCDRCDKEITGDIYRVKITADSQSKSTWNKINDALDFATAVSNVNEYIIAEPPMYCQDCKEEFEFFLKINPLKE